MRSRQPSEADDKVAFKKDVKKATVAAGVQSNQLSSSAGLNGNRLTEALRVGLNNQSLFDHSYNGWPNVSSDLIINTVSNSTVPATYFNAAVVLNSSVSSRRQSIAFWVS